MGSRYGGQIHVQEKTTACVTILLAWLTGAPAVQIAEPDNLRDRLVDILTSCIEAEREAQASSVFTAGPVTVDNSRDEGTFVTLAVRPLPRSVLPSPAAFLVPALVAMTYSAS